MASTNIYRRGGNIIDAVSMAASITSDVVDIQNVFNASVQCVAASGTHVGTIAVQLSNDRTNWVDVVFSDGTSSIAASSGAALNALVNLSELSAQWLRAVYTATSGAGTLTVTCVLKRGA